MKHKDLAVAAVAKEGAAEFPNLSRRFHPALRFCVEISKFLQRTVFCFRQKLDAHGGREINSVTGRVNTLLFSFLLPCSVVTDAPAALRAFR